MNDSLKVFYKLDLIFLSWKSADPYIYLITVKILKGSSSEHLVVIVLHLPSSLGHYCESKNETEKPTRSSRIFPVSLGVAETIIGYFFFFSR